MANEIAITINATISNGDYKSRFEPGQIQIDQNSLGADEGILVCTTTATAIPKRGISTDGVLMLRNLHATNWATLESSTGRKLLRISAGEALIGRLHPGAGPKIRASTTGAASVDVEYHLFEN